MAENLYELLIAGNTVWLVLAWAVVTPLSRFGTLAARRRLRAPTAMMVLHVGLILLVAGIDSAGYDPRTAAIAAFAFSLLAFIGLAQILVFWIALPRVGVRVPRIVVDVATAVVSIIALIAVGKRAGFSVTGLITTSAVLTAVIGFAMQDTLGNLIGGLALQMDSSIRVGDWISLGPNQPAGQVSEIRWRYTAIETRNWETVIVPNSIDRKSVV